MIDNPTKHNDFLPGGESFNSIDEFKNLRELPDTKPLVMVDARGTIEYANNAFKNLFSLGEGENFDAFNSEPDIVSLIQNLINNNYQSFHFDLFLLDAASFENSSFYVDIDRILIKGSQFFVMLLSSHFERKKLEDRINNLHNALEYGDVSVIITDENGIINYSSKPFETILSTGIEQLYNRYLPDVFVEYLTKEELDGLKKAINNKDEWVKLISNISSDGSLWFKEIKLNIVQKGDDESYNFILVAHDITNYILKTRVIKNSEQRQKSIINNISDPLIIIRKQNNELIFESANEIFFNAFSVGKIKVEKVLSKALKGDLYDTLMKAIINSEIDKEHHTQFRYRNKKYRRDYIGKITYTDDPYDNVRLFIVNFSDITEQMKIQEQLQNAYEKETRLNKLKSAFMANISHEIRTPLNAIVGYSELIEDDIEMRDYDSIQENARYLKDGVNRLLNLVENIVEASIIESGEYEFDYEILNVNSLLYQIHKENLSKTRELNISFDLNLCEKQLKIKVDEFKFSKIFDMIIDNAIKYNKRDGNITLETFTEDGYVIIELSDTGIGIEKDKLDRILEPFIQEEEEGYKRKYEGAGLGLTIAYKLTILQKGEFSIESTPDAGTKVTIKFARQTH
ncbi:MAG: ATP-binding protein [Ignavibacteria bacterium]|jgi:PAS domain S-box-containing protein